MPVSTAKAAAVTNRYTNRVHKFPSKLYPHFGMSAHRGRPPCVMKEVGWFCGSRVEAAAAWPSSGVPSGGRGSEVPESAVLRLRSAGALPSAGAACRNPAGS
jgi:hypothetical protein